MEEEDFDSINFKNKDIVHISSRSTTRGSVANGNSSGSFNTVKRTSGDNYAAVTRGGISNSGRSSGSFKIVKLNEDGTGTVGRLNLGSGRSSSRTISGRAAKRKINRMRNRM